MFLYSNQNQEKPQIFSPIFSCLPPLPVALRSECQTYFFRVFSIENVFLNKNVLRVFWFSLSFAFSFSLFAPETALPAASTSVALPPDVLGRRRAKGERPETGESLFRREKERRKPGLKTKRKAVFNLFENSQYEKQVPVHVHN